MNQLASRRGFLWRSFAVPVLSAVAVLFAGLAQAQEPIKIGFSMALTGPLAGAGQGALLAMQIWEDDINKKGGLLGRKVKLVYYDDKSSPAEVPAIYSKLLDIDKVELIVGPYASTQVAAALPIAIQRKKTLIGLFATGVNDKFKYNQYFSMIPTGPSPRASFTKGFFDVAMAQNPKPKTVAIAAADAEFGRNVQDGALQNAKEAKLEVVYNRTYPPSTTDFGPIVRAVQAANPDILVICSYPLDSVGWVRALSEVGYTPKMVGGGMVGLQFTAIKQQLGPLLNGFVNYETWLPHKSMQYPGAMEVVEKYQERAKGQKLDPLGYYLPPWAYAYLQTLAQAITATKSLDDAKLAEWLHKNPVKTVVGDIRFGPTGEWTESRFLQVQYQNIGGTDMKEFTDMSKQPILSPDSLKTGKVIYPFANARKK